MSETQSQSTEVWKRELIKELEFRKQHYKTRGEAADSEDVDYWNGVANGIDEAIDLAEEIENEEMDRGGSNE